MEVLDSLEKIKEPPKERAAQIIFEERGSFWAYALPIWIATTTWRVIIANGVFGRLFGWGPAWEPESDNIFYNGWFQITKADIFYPIFMAIALGLLLKFTKRGWLILALYFLLDITFQYGVAYHKLSASDILGNACFHTLTFTLAGLLTLKYQRQFVLTFAVAFVISSFIAFSIPIAYELSKKYDETLFETVNWLYINLEYLKLETVQLLTGLITAGVLKLALLLFPKKPFNPSATTE